jgi:hypothetical protein
LKEAKRGALLQAQLPTPSPVGYNTFVQLWAGSDPFEWLTSLTLLKGQFGYLEWLNGLAELFVTEYLC